MKQIEVFETWNLFMEAINDWEHKRWTKDNKESGSNADVIAKECKNLAKYSVEADMGHGKKTHQEFLRMEKDGKIVSSHIFVRLARHFYLQGVVERRDTKQLCDLFYTIHAFLGNQYYYAVRKEIVEKLLLLGSKYSRVYQYQPNPYEQRMAESALYLKEQGFLISVECGTISYSEQTAQELFDRLDRKIATVGGGCVFRKILIKHLQYVETMDRYLLGRKIDDEQNVPFNLLLQLAAKHLEWEKGSEHAEEKVIDEIERLADAMLDICDIQGTSGMEYSMLDWERFPLYLINEMMFEKLCVPRQYSVRFVLVSLDYLIKPWFFHAKTEYTYRDYYKLAECVLKNEGVHHLNMSNIREKTGLSKRRIQMILKSVALPIGEVNREFVSLDGKVNLFSRPVIAFPLGRYLFLDQHFCGMGFFYAARDMIRQNFPELDRHQGEAIEGILKSEMDKKGYRMKYGKYKEKNGLREGECDLVLEGKRLVFLEMKKKDIADEMDELDDVKLLESMTYGMVKAQKQCFGHERYLDTNQKIEFEDEKQEIILSEGKLPAYKISICYPEYAFLTNKMFSMNLLEILLMGGFRAVDPSRQGELDKLNRLGFEIRNCVYAGGKQANAREISFYSLFCSLQQILTAVWWCENEEEFFEVIREWIYGSDKTLDPYVSIFALKCVPEENRMVRKSMLELVEKRGMPTMVIG